LIAGFVYVSKGAPSTSCGPFRTWVHTQRPRYVLLVTGLFETLDFHVAGGPRVVAGTPAYARIYAATLQRDIDDLTSTGATLIIPTVPCMSPGYLTPEQIEELASNPARRAVEDDLLRSVAARKENRGRVVVPDLDSFVCPHGTYERALGSVADARPDGMHFAPAAADLVASWLLREVPGLRHATVGATALSPAEAVSDSFNLHGVICQMGRAQSENEGVPATFIPCMYEPHVGIVITGNLRVFAGAAQRSQYERYLRRTACAAAGPNSKQTFSYLRGTNWILTGYIVAASARLVSRTPTRFVC
jgi:hypothetical protein